MLYSKSREMETLARRKTEVLSDYTSKPPPSVSDILPPEGRVPESEAWRVQCGLHVNRRQRKITKENYGL